MNRPHIRKTFAPYLETPVTKLLIRLNVPPNFITITGLAIAGASCYFLSIGFLWISGIVVLLSGIVDMFDGALARATGRSSQFGALLDSVVDRLSEMVVLLGILLFYIQQSSLEGLLLVYFAMAGSFLVSYMRARAEGLGIDCDVGIASRTERLIVLCVGLVLGHWWPISILVVLSLIAGLGFVTAGQRMVHTWTRLNKGP